MNKENHFGRTSILSIKTAYRYGKTILEDSYFSVPFKITKPFYNDKQEMKLIVMSASAGLMAGDSQEINLDIGEHTNVCYTTQSYEKIHKMEDGFASKKINIIIQKDGYLKYRPLSTIPFAGSALDSRLEIHLEDKTSKLFFSEIISAGRVAHGEMFEYQYYKSTITIKEQGKWIYRDNTCYSPKDCDLMGFGMFEGYTHLANILIVNLNKERDLVEKIRNLLGEIPTISGGASISESGAICVKVFGRSAQELERIIERISVFVDE